MVSKFLSHAVLGVALGVTSAPAPVTENTLFFDKLDANEIQFEPPHSTLPNSMLGSGVITGPTPLEKAFRELWVESKKPQTTLNDLLSAPLKSDASTQDYFAGTHLEDDMSALKESGFNQYALTGSAALWVISKALEARGLDGFDARMPNDLDVRIGAEDLSNPNVGGIRASSIAGHQAELQREDGRGKNVDVTTFFPSEEKNAPHQDSKYFEGITMDVDGTRVMLPEFVLGYKSMSSFLRAPDQTEKIQNDMEDVMKATKVLMPDAEIPKGTLDATALFSQGTTTTAAKARPRGFGFN